MTKFIITIEKSTAYRAEVDAEDPIAAQADVMARIKSGNLAGMTVGVPKFFPVLVRRLEKARG